MTIQRIRTTIAGDGGVESVDDEITLERIDAARIEIEGRAAGLDVLPAREIAPAPGSDGRTVVLLRG